MKDHDALAVSILVKDEDFSERFSTLEMDEFSVIMEDHEVLGKF